MKTAIKVPNDTTPSPPVQAAPSADAPASSESQGLSPQRIEDGVATKTEVLDEILEHAEKNSRLLHWGIND